MQDRLHQPTALKHVLFYPYFFLARMTDDPAIRGVALSGSGSGCFAYRRIPSLQH